MIDHAVLRRQLINLPQSKIKTLQRGSFQTNQTLINPDLQPNSEMGSRLQGSVPDFGLGKPNNAPLRDPGIETQQARLLGNLQGPGQGPNYPAHILKRSPV